MMFDIGDFLQGYFDCERGEEPQKTTKDYERGYSRRYQYEQMITHNQTKTGISYAGKNT